MKDKIPICARRDTIIRGHSRRRNYESEWDRSYPNGNDRSKEDYYRSPSDRSRHTRYRRDYNWLKCGCRNVKGWCAQYITDNHFGRETCIQKCDLDIIGIAETRLKSDTNLFVQGFKWVDQDRKALDIKAKKGCGGVGFHIKEDLFREFDVKIIDTSVEGIL